MQAARVYGMHTFQHITTIPALGYRLCKSSGDWQIGLHHTTVPCNVVQHIQEGMYAVLHTSQGGTAHEAVGCGISERHNSLKSHLLLSMCRQRQRSCIWMDWAALGRAPSQATGVIEICGSVCRPT